MIYARRSSQRCTIRIYLKGGLDIIGYWQEGDSLSHRVSAHISAMNVRGAVV